MRKSPLGSSVSGICGGGTKQLDAYFIFCNANCGAVYQITPSSSFYITQCGHVICGRCKNASDQRCPVCQTPMKNPAHLSLQMDPKLKRLFEEPALQMGFDIMKTIRERIHFTENSVKFRRSQCNRFSKFVCGLTEKSKKLMAQNRTLNEELQRCQQQIRRLEADCNAQKKQLQLMDNTHKRVASSGLSPQQPSLKRSSFLDSRTPINVLPRANSDNFFSQTSHAILGVAAPSRKPRPTTNFAKTPPASLNASQQAGMFVKPNANQLRHSGTGFQAMAQKIQQESRSSAAVFGQGRISIPPNTNVYRRNCEDTPNGPPTIPRNAFNSPGSSISSVFWK